MTEKRRSLRVVQNAPRRRSHDSEADTAADAAIESILRRTPPDLVFSTDDAAKRTA